MTNETDDLVVRIGKHLKDIRNSKGLSQMDVASAAGIDKSAYQRIERGRTNPSVNMLNKVIEALEKNISEFFCSLPK